MVSKEDYNGEKVFYDVSARKFVRVNITDNELQLIYPDKDEVFHTVKKEEEWQDIINELEHYQVDYSVVENPDEYLKNWLEKQLQENYHNINLTYAVKNSEIIEERLHS